MVSLVFLQVFAEGFERYGDLGFSAECLAAHLRTICAKYAVDDDESQLAAFIESLHKLDLYLSFGCACQDPRAWQCFANEFHTYIGRLSAAITQSDEEATELTDSVVADLCLPDRSGRSRIGSFEGRSSLATWLRVMVSHRAVNQRKRSRHAPRGTDPLPDTADETALPRLDAVLREHRYGEALNEALRRACGSLNERERLVLRLRFGEMQKVQEIAARLHVHPSNVTRQIERVCERLRNAVIHTLGERYHLSGSQIAECLPDIVENPRYSVLALLERDDGSAEPCSAEAVPPGWVAAAIN